MQVQAHANVFSFVSMMCIYMHVVTVKFIHNKPYLPVKHLASITWHYTPSLTTWHMHVRTLSLSSLTTSKFVKLINFDMISEFRRIYFLFYFNSKGQPCINPRANYFSVVFHWTTGMGSYTGIQRAVNFFYYASALLALCQWLTTVSVLVIVKYERRLEH